MPWEQPPPPEVSKGNALAAEQNGHGEGGGGAAGGGAGAGGIPAVPLSPMLANGLKSSAEPKGLQRLGAVGGSAGAGMGGAPMAPYAPMGAMGRGDQNHGYESTQPAAALDGAGEAAAGVSDSGQSWLPSTGQNDSPFMVSSVSWGPDTAVFDELAVPDEGQPEGFADEPETHP